MRMCERILQRRIRKKRVTQELEERDIRGGFPKRVSTVQSMISRNLDWHENLVYKRKRQLHFSGLA